jgi:hypothetical protein
MRDTVYVLCMISDGVLRTYHFNYNTSREKNKLKDVGTNGGIILKGVLRKQACDGMECIQVIQ